MADFESLRQKYYPDFKESLPPWGLPTPETFRELSQKLDVPFPPSYVDFCCTHAGTIPIPGGDFKWATADSAEDAYASLEIAIEDAWNLGAPRYYIAFSELESNFYCFDTRFPDEQGEFPIVFWVHDAPNADELHQFPDFVHWVTARLEGFRSFV